MGEPRPGDRDGLAQGAGRPQANGTATIVAAAGSVEVEDDRRRSRGWSSPAPVSFRNDVIPAFSQAGCNMGACHGTPTGKGGFKLSLRGYLPDQDYIDPHPRGRRPADQPARRRDQPDPPQAAGRGPARGGPAARPRTPRPTSSSTTGSPRGRRTTPAPRPPCGSRSCPGARVLNAPAKTQQIVVAGPLRRRHRSATSRRSATTTRRTPRSPRSTPTATSRSRPGARSRSSPTTSNLVANVRLTHLVEVPGFAVAEVPQDNVIDRAVFAKLNRMRIAPVRARAPTRSSSAASTSTPSASCPRPTRSRRSWPTRRPTRRGQARSTGCSTGPSSTTSGP